MPSSVKKENKIYLFATWQPWQRETALHSQLKGGSITRMCKNKERFKASKIFRGKMIDGRMIVFHSQRKAMEFIDGYEKCQDEKLAVERVPG